MTRKLYDENAYTKRFSARVEDCCREGERYAVILDATAFFPEGGGQAGDTGRLGTVSVLDTRLRGGQVIHLCDGPLPAGQTVEGVIDWDRRFTRMQQHSGEHILSGLVHRLTGFENVGFHMGADVTTVDFSGRLTDGQITELLAMANAAVQEDRPIRARYPAPEELATLTYRSKKALEGPVRLVEVEGIDLCACCAPHVSSTGQVGPIVILSRESLHGGTRLQMLCGGPAWTHISAVMEQNRGISALLSARPLETLAAAERMTGELAQSRQQLAAAARELYAALAETHRGAGDVLLFREIGDPGKLAEAVAATCGGQCFVFLQTEKGYRYAGASSQEDLRPAARDMHGALGGKGGGRPGLVQGSVPAGETEIRAFFGRRA